jgi:FAD/FMN-containing dehydrogenase
VDSPHTWLVHEDLPRRWAAADLFDPSGLLNPGKLPRTATTV